MKKFIITDINEATEAKSGQEAIRKYNESCNVFFSIMGFLFAAVFAAGAEWQKVVAAFCFIISSYVLLRRDKIKLNKNWVAVEVRI